MGQGPLRFAFRSPCWMRKSPIAAMEEKASFALPSLFGSALPFFQTPAAVFPKEAELDEDCIS